jgi:hypothetical protein
LTSAPLRRPAWLRDDDALITVGLYWDVLVVPWHIGIAAMSVLDQPVLDPFRGGRTGPVIAYTGRHPRLYFLVPCGRCWTARTCPRGACPPAAIWRCPGPRT